MSRDLRPSWLLALALLACGDATDGNNSTDSPKSDGVCVDDTSFFRTQVWPEVLETECMACHTADGAARDSDFVLVTTARPDHFEVNQAELADVAGLEREGTSIILRKPLGLDAHGGGAVLSEQDAGFALLEDFVARLKDPVVCEGDEDDPLEADLGLTLLSPSQTLRKASLSLAGRLPTPAESDTVRAGGEDALTTALWQLMSEEAFYDRLLEVLNDEFLTDRYLLGRDGIGIFDDDRFPSVYWYESYDGDDYSDFRDNTSYAIAREPLQLAAWVVRNDRPWTEILTANYTVVDGYLGQAYGVSVPYPGTPEGDRWRQVTVPGVPHAGLLTTPAFLNRYPTTPTNRNRHRAWAFFKKFLATDILSFADRPIDPTISDAHNPTLNDPQCIVCHETMDPVAGAFQNWDDEGRLNPREEGWYGEMATPGFGDFELPGVQRSSALQWLAQQTVEDPRFAVASVRMVLEAFTGVELLTAQLAGDDPTLTEALALQDLWIAEVSDEFAERGYEIKWVIEQVMRSHWFRAVEQEGAPEAVLHFAGTAHLLTPEELDRKILATTGLVWREAHNQSNLLLDRYRMLYGGIDSFGTVERLAEPNGIIASIGLRMANDMACESIPRDLVLTASQRRLLPYVETTYVPETLEGFAIPEAEQRIRENIQYLHNRILGEDLGLDDPELDATYALWTTIWKEGRDGILDDERIDDALPGDCRAETDWWTGERLPSERQVRYDENHTIRAWMAVTAYLLSDYRFFYE